MELHEFFGNVQTDVICKTFPRVVVKTAAIVVAGGGFGHLDYYKEDLARYTAASITNIVSSNVAQYTLYNTYRKNLNFGKKMQITFSSSAFATLMTNIAFCSDKNIKNMVIYPLVEGATTTLIYTFFHHEEASRYFRAYHPHIHHYVANALKTTNLDKPIKWFFSKVDSK